jgi:hypothetical protein
MASVNRSQASTQRSHAAAHKAAAPTANGEPRATTTAVVVAMAAQSKQHSTALSWLGSAVAMLVIAHCWQAWLAAVQDSLHSAAASRSDTAFLVCRS